MNIYTGKVTVWHMLAFALALCMVTMPFAIYPNIANNESEFAGLDPSWQMTLNFALIKHLVWGRDIVYTYGPLGFLGTRIGWGIPVWVFVLFDLFVFANFYQMFRDYLLGDRNKLLSLIIMFGICVSMSPTHGADLSWILTAFTCYWIYKTNEDPKGVYFAFAIVNVVICFFLKFNAGFVGVSFFAAHLLLLLQRKKISVVKTVIVFGALLSLLIIGITGFHVLLPDYIKGALEIVKGYNDSMFIYLNSYSHEAQTLAILFYGFIILFSGYVLFLVLQKKYANILFPCIAFAYIFLLRKQGIVRNDLFHYHEFFSFSPLILLTGVLSYQTQRSAMYFRGAVAAIVVMAAIFNDGMGNSHFPRFVKWRFTAPVVYLKSMTAYDEGRYASQKEYRCIPDGVLQKIGAKTVDIFPWDTEYLIENNLNFLPRPVFQSYHANTPYLRDVNYAAFSTNAPEFILYHYKSIDERYAFNDDILVNFFIAKNYACVDSFTSNSMLFLLLQKKAGTEPLHIIHLGDITVGLNDNIPLSGAQMLRIHAPYNRWGKAESFFYIAPVAKLLITTEDDSAHEYKTSSVMLETGIEVDKDVTTTQDFYQYISSKPNLRNIKTIKLEADPNEFEHKMVVERYIVR